jgi:hypothetical protein
MSQAEAQSKLSTSAVKIEYLNPWPNNPPLTGVTPGSLFCARTVSLADFEREYGQSCYKATD